MQDFLSPALKILVLIILAASSLKILREYERGVIFRLGRFSKVKGPGLIFIIPLIDRMVKTDLRLISIDVPRQEIMTRDNVPVTVDAVVYFKITEPGKALVEIANYYQSTFLIAQTTLRSVLGQSDLDELLSKRDIINQKLREIIDNQTTPWGVKVDIVEIKEVALPEVMKRAMAKQAETERERRAKIIESEGEKQVAVNLVEASKIIGSDPVALKLRYLQTIRGITDGKSPVILFPLPGDLFDFLKDRKKE
ncbi:MAG: slipin family protein [Elusimicrobiota bacterium]